MLDTILLWFNEYIGIMLGIGIGLFAGSFYHACSRLEGGMAGPRTLFVMGVGVIMILTSVAVYRIFKK